MKHRTRWPAAAVTVVLLVACGGDDPTGVENGGEEPQLLLQSITQEEGGPPVDPDDVEGSVLVNLEVVPGGETVTRLAVTVDGAEVSERDVSISSGDPDTEVSLGLNTAAFDEETLEVDFPNSTYDVSALLETDEGGTVEASESRALEFNNDDVLAVEHVEGTGNTAVTGGIRWFGGADVTLRARALAFSQPVQIQSIGVTCTSSGQSANGGASVDLGAGAGAEATSGTPFEYTAAADANRGSVEDRPGDGGHTCAVTSVRDVEDVEVLGDFDAASVQELEDFYLDFVAPRLDDGGPSEVTVDGSPVTAGDFYSRGGFGVSNASELGAGFADDGGLVVDVLVGGEVQIEAASTIEDDVPERTDEYVASAVSVADAVGNAADPGAVDDTPDGFGVDKTAPVVSDPLPAGPGVYRLDGSDVDHILVWNVEDPDLADGSPGTGVDHAGVRATVIEEDGTETTFTPADAELTGNLNGDIESGDYGMDVSFFDDGELVITVTTPDGGATTALNVANEGDLGFDGLVLDNTAPVFGGVDPPSGSAGTDAGSLLQEIAGSIDEPHFDEAEIFVLSDGDDVAGTDPHDDGDGGDGVADLDDACDFPAAPGDPDEVLNVGNGPGRAVGGDTDIDRNAVGIGQTFSESFELFDPGNSTVSYCYVVRAADSATDNTGAADPNTASLTTRADVTWTTP